MKLFYHIRFRWAVAIGFTLVFSACQKDLDDQTYQQGEKSHDLKHKKGGGLQRYDAQVIQSWYKLMLDLAIETPGHTPPVLARSFGYAGVALYESLVGDMPNHHSLVGQLNGLNSIPPRKYGNSYHAPITVNAALASIIKKLFQNVSAANLSNIDALEAANNNLYAGRVSQQIMNRSIDYGRAVAGSVYTWSQSDGGHQAYLQNFPPGYIPPTGLDKWVPTPPLFRPALLPYWGNNRNMVVANNVGPVDPPGPPAFSSTYGSSFYNAAYDVYDTGLHLTADQLEIAAYWDDGAGTFTPPGHNVAIALQMIRNQGLHLGQAAVLMVKLGIAENDAGIVCWRAKYTANLLRPVTFIQTYIDPAWNSLITNPPFPTYTSGHSTFSGAAAAILTAELGNAVSFTDSTKIGYGFSPRSFPNFTAYGREAKESRLYGGIHYVFDNEHGFECGVRIAHNVEQLKW